LDANAWRLILMRSGRTDAMAAVVKHTRHPELPWPTTIMHDAAAKLRQEDRLPTAVVAAAQQRLDHWLAKPAGPLRAWCRETKPRVLAACALLKASRDASSGGAGEAASSGLIVAQSKGSAISALRAAVAVGLAVGATVGAAGASANDEAAASAVEAALAALPAAGT